MKKKVFGRKLSREKDTRLALFRSLIRSMILHSKIKTTNAKAKAVRKDIEKLVHLAKIGTLQARRKVYAYLANDRALTDKLFGVIAKSFPTRKSGFTRITALGKRRGDGAEMVRLEWTEEIGESIKGTKSTKSIKTRKSAKKLVKPVKESL